MVRPQTYEAIRWAQLYPNEVSAIIGLDMVTPQSYARLPLNVPVIRLGAILVNTGRIRLLPIVNQSATIKNGGLSEAEKELYRPMLTLFQPLRVRCDPWLRRRSHCSKE